MELSLWIIPIFALCALLFAAYKARYVSSASPGNARMQEIAGSIAEGASAFLRSEYKILAIFIAVLFVLISLFINLGTGMVTIALASLIIGETIIGRGGMFKKVIGVILGSCLYRFIVAIALRMSVPAECLKLVSALIVAFAIAFPYLKGQAAFLKTRKALERASRKDGGSAC